MSIKSVIAEFEAEKAEIKGKIAELQARDEVLDLLIKEVRAVGRGGARKTGARKAAGKKAKVGKGKAPKAPKATAKGVKKGSMTVREGIVKTVAAAGAPLTAGEIIAGAAKLSGGAVPSIRTQINALARLGEIQQVPYEGRGFKYQMPAAPAKQEKAGE